MICVEVKQSWMVVYQSQEAESEMTMLCAQGYPDEDVAKHMRLSGLVSQLTDEDVRMFRKHSAKSITQFSDKSIKDLISRVPRSKKAYRIGEIDKKLSIIADAITPDMVSDKPLWAARLMTTYLQAMKQLAEEAGDFSGGEVENKWIQLMGEADLNQKKQLTAKLLELEQLAKDIQKGDQKEPEPLMIPRVVVDEAVPEDEPIEAEFEVEE